MDAIEVQKKMVESNKTHTYQRLDLEYAEYVRKCDGTEKALRAVVKYLAVIGADELSAALRELIAEMEAENG